MFSTDVQDKIKKMNSEIVTDVISDLLPLDNIIFDTQYRQDISGYDLQGLADNIFQLSKPSVDYPVGLLQAIQVTIQDDGKALIDAGEMRVRAFMLLREKYPEDKRWNAIPHRVSKVNILERSERDLIQLSENLKRDEGTVFDIAKKISELLESVGVDKVVQVLLSSGQKATSKTAISRWKKLAKANDELVKDAKELKIEDKATIALLIDIYKKDHGKYCQLIIDYKTERLDSSLYDAAKKLMKNIKELEQKIRLVEENPNNTINKTSGDDKESLSDNNSEKNSEEEKSFTESFTEDKSEGREGSLSESPNKAKNDKVNSDIFEANNVTMLANGILRISGVNGMLNIKLPQGTVLEIIQSE